MATHPEMWHGFYNYQQRQLMPSNLLLTQETCSLLLNNFVVNSYRSVLRSCYSVDNMYCIVYRKLRDYCTVLYKNNYVGYNGTSTTLIYRRRSSSIPVDLVTMRWWYTSLSGYFVVYHMCLFKPTASAVNATAAVLSLLRTEQRMSQQCCCCWRYVVCSRLWRTAALVAYPVAI